METKVLQVYLMVNELRNIQIVLMFMERLMNVMQ